MSGSGSNGNHPNHHFGTDGDYSKRKRHHFTSSTRRDFKSSAHESLSSPQSQPSLASDRRVSSDLPPRQRYRDSSRDTGHDHCELRDTSRESTWDRYSRDSNRDLNKDGYIKRDKDRDAREGRDLSREHREHRDNTLLVASTSSQNPTRNPRANSYSKDYRYENYGRQYSSYSNGSFTERGDAYGSLNGSKRSEQDYFSYSSRDNTNRDTTRPRDSWHSEKPRQPSSLRFNPNSIPINLRSTLNTVEGTSISEHKKERYDSYDEQYSNRHRSSRRPENYARSDRALSDYTNRSIQRTRDRLHSSSLTNSVRTTKSTSKSFSGYHSRNTDHYQNDLGGSGPESRSFSPVDRHSPSMQQDLEETSGLYKELPRDNVGLKSDQTDVSALREETPEQEMNKDSETTMKGSPVLSTRLDPPSVKNDFRTYQSEVDLEETVRGETTTKDNETADASESMSQIVEISGSLKIKGQVDKAGDKNIVNIKAEEKHKVDDMDDIQEETEHSRGAVEDADDEDALDAIYSPSTALISREVSEVPEKIEPEFVIKTAKETELKVEAQLLTVTKPPQISDLSFDPDLVPMMYPDGCLFPYSRLEAEYEQLQQHYEDKGQRSPFFNEKSLSDFSHYRFYCLNLRSFVARHEKLHQIVQGAQKAVRRSQLAAWAEYEDYRQENDKRVAFMNEQLRVLHPGDDEATKELLSIDARQKDGVLTPQQLGVEKPPLSGRRNRRHGDLVTTEAEFQAILKTLENEENETPMAKARRVAATIPDLIINPVQRHLVKFMDSNNFVFDKNKWADRINTDFTDTFTEREHDTFCEAFCQYPKKFGQVSQVMGGLRLSRECVLHYYMTKKVVNYKLLLAQYKKKSKKQIRRRKKKSVSALPSAEDLAKSKYDGADEVDSALDTPTLESASAKRAFDELTLVTPEAEEPQPKRIKESADAKFRSPSSEKTVAEHDAELDEIDEEEDTVNGASTGDKRKLISSYWSITESDEFPHLLNQYGSQWSKIAEKLATKSATMVRNQYQRKGRKYGWTKVVAAADQRLARKPYAAGENRYSKFDTTLIVKPQRSTDAVMQNTEIHVYDATELSQGTNRIPVSNFTGSPLISGSSSAVGSEAASPTPSSHAFSPTVVSNGPGGLPYSSHTPTERSKTPVTASTAYSNHTKPSILSLLNVESPSRPQPQPLVKSQPQPQRQTTSQPTTAANRGNIASLLNTPSSPAALPHLPAHRSGNINSLVG